ncbi:MAG: hypothetical protein Q9227_006071 [Pyrenula ochraceoflavens]
MGNALFITILLGLVARIAAQTSGTFNVLSMNVAGLPAILNGNGDGDKTTATQQIGEDFNENHYDVIHVQEYDEHPYRTATSGGVPFGSGLNTLSNYNWIDFSRTKWTTCSDASENDCLTPKGFTFMRVRFAPGVYIDFVNLHADAGIEEGDETARNANLQQVADYISTSSVGNAVLIYGDTNSRVIDSYTRAADNIRLYSNYGFTDAWVRLVKSGTAPAAGSTDLLCDMPVPASTACEVVDKVLFRPSNLINLSPTSFSYDASRFLNSSGGALSDHIPVHVDFSWSLSSSLRASDLQGGTSGNWFNDLPTLPSNPVARLITLRGGSRLDAVELTLSNGDILSHGGTGGTASSLSLNSGELITGGTLCTGSYNGGTRNFYASFTTSLGRSVTGGAKTNTCYTMNAPSGYSLVGFYGKDGNEMDLLGFIWGH